VSADIANAKQQLPLPALLHRLRLGAQAKKSARCPFHDDQHNSFSVYKNVKGEFRFKCFASCGEGDEITFLEKYHGISNKEATKLFLEMAGVNGAMPSPSKQGFTPAFDWRACVNAFTDADMLSLQIQRRYSRKLCSWLKENALIGKYKDCFAFPVHDRARNVVACHHRPKDGSWRYYPQGAKVRPLIIGELVAGDTVHVFESYWDAFAFMDKSGERHGIIITRGASNGALVAGLIPAEALVYAWKQNDELKNGKRAGDEWLKEVVQHAGAKVRCPKTPSQFKDLNDWTRAGATDKDLLGAIVEAEKAAAVEAQSRAAKLAPLLDSICAFVRRYIIFQTLEQVWVIALWVAHCWVVEAFDFTPYLHINSPEKQCAKTRLLDCLALLVVKAWRAILPSEAVLFHKIEKDRPTLLLDEVDGIFTSNGKDERREALRSLLNAGFERGAKVPRCVGQGSNYQVQEFAVFGAKALAGIGRLPDTISDRSVPIQLVRRASDEKVERFRKRQAEKEASTIRAELEAWAQPDIIEKLREARPSLPDALSDRQQDICEPLLVIAEMAGGDWPERGRTALVNLCSKGNEETESLGVKLLSDSRKAFDAMKTDKLSTEQLLKTLVDLETDAPWAGWWEADLKNGNTRGPAQKLAKLLGAYKIKPDGIRLPDASTPRGYRIEQFREAWKRYLPSNALNNATTQHSDELSL
jgi:hypothetical protein